MDNERYFDATKGDSGKLFDLFDNPITDLVVQADIKTGHCLCYWLVNGQPVVNYSGNLKTYSKMFPAPLRFVRDNP